MLGEQSKRQAGFALLIFLVVLMGLGGIALTGVTQSFKKSVDEKRFEHNKKVLTEAKQALLMYAYNYPEIAGRGPGRLPCPDMNISGTPNPPCPASNPNIGRLPWDALGMNFYDIKDSTNESLWYAVSSTFDNGPSTTINSDSTGTITVFDQTGSLVYDGAADGIAAVIIAPGAPIARDEDNDGVYEYQQVRGTVPQQIDPRNYLDTFNDFDNSLFNNGESDTNDDGFILGPVSASATDRTIVVNDQMIVITVAEVIEMAEKATLQAYRDAINEYLTNTGANNYPWLFNYDLNDLDTFPGLATTVSAYPLGSLTNIGRIPSIFSGYFSEESSQPIDSEIRLIVTKNFELDGKSFAITLDQQSSILNNVMFEDTDPQVDSTKRLTASPGSYTPPITRFFSETSFLSGDWEECPSITNSLSDCNRNASGAFWSGSNNLVVRVAQVSIQLDLTGGIGIDIGLDYTTPPTMSYSPASAAPDTHAEIRATFPSASVTGVVGKLYWLIGSYTLSGGYAPVYDEQPLDSNIDQGFITNLSTGDITIGVRYYPELPIWAHSNNWHDSIMMAIAPDYQPGGAKDCVTNAPCLSVNGKDDKVAILAIAGEIAALIDEGADGFGDDLVDIFDPENDDTNNAFSSHEGNDSVLVLQ